MGQRLTLMAPRQIGYESYEDKPLQPDQVRLKTLYSGISAGTELTLYRGTNPYLRKRWHPDTRLFLAAEESSLQYPVHNLGYEEVGEVIEVGPAVNDISIGSRVSGTWGHNTHHIAAAAEVRPRLLPADLEPILGIFSHIGAIALNGVHDGRIRIGDTVAVFGSGVPGQIVAQLARQSGARVIAVDLLETRLALAESLGAHVTLNARQGNVAEAIKELTGNRGADVCFEVSGSTHALNEAIRAAAYSARVVTMGFFQGEAEGLYLGEEFHHNRINLVCSQIAGTDPELTYRWDRLRLAQTAIRLQAEGILNLRPLISHILPFGRAGELYALLDHTPEQAMQTVIDFEEVR